MGTRPAIDADDLFVWRLNESGPPFLNTGSAGSAGDLIQVGSVTPSQAAIWDNGVLFPGTAGNYLRTTDTSLGEVDALSMCAWVYPMGVASGTSDGGSVVEKQIKDTGGSGPSYRCSVGMAMAYPSSIRRPVMKYTRADNNDYTVWLNAGGFTWVENTQWYLLSCNLVTTASPQGRREVFINGMQCGFNIESSGTGTNWGNHGPWIIGNNTVNGYGFIGIIGEIRVSTVTRPPSYWRQYYAAGVDYHTGEEVALDPTKPRSMLPIYE